MYSHLIYLASYLLVLRDCIITSKFRTIAFHTNYLTKQGMYNAIIDDELLNATGVYKERLSQAALVAEMAKVTMEEKCSARKWLDEK